MSNEHLKISISMFIFGSFLAQHGIKLTELSIKPMATRRKIQWGHIQLLILKFEWISEFAYIEVVSWWVTYKLHATGVATSPTSLGPQPLAPSLPLWKFVSSPLSILYLKRLTTWLQKCMKDVIQIMTLYKMNKWLKIYWKFWY